MVLTEEMLVLRMDEGSRGTLRMNGGTSDGFLSPGNFGTRTPCTAKEEGGPSSRNILFTASSQSCNSSLT